MCVGPRMYVHMYVRTCVRMYAVCMYAYVCMYVRTYVGMNPPIRGSRHATNYVGDILYSTHLLLTQATYAMADNGYQRFALILLWHPH